MRKNAHGLWDAPLWKDWLAYVTGLGIYGAVDFTYRQGQGLIDFLLNIFVQVALFGVIPGAVRILVRRSVARHRQMDG